VRVRNCCGPHQHPDQPGAARASSTGEPDPAAEGDRPEGGRGEGGAGGRGILVIQVMAVSMGTLGVLLASLSDPAELDDPGSLTCRITPGEARRKPGDWEYELVAARYPIDHGVVFLAKIRLPAAGLPEVSRA
jgi:hypothetical protein